MSDRDSEIQVGSEIVVDNDPQFCAVTVVRRDDDEIYWQEGQYTAHCDVSRCELVSTFMKARMTE